MSSDMARVTQFPLSFFQISKLNYNSQSFFVFSFITSIDTLVILGLCSYTSTKPWFWSHANGFEFIIKSASHFRPVCTALMMWGKAVEGLGTI